MAISAISVLGPLVVDGDDSSLGPRDRVVLAALALRPGDVVLTEQLADALWGESLPASWNKVVQGCVVRLRKQLGTATIETVPTGYRLLLSSDAVDASRFQRLVDRSRELTAIGEPERAAYLLGEALALWRGRPFAELEAWAPGRIEADRLEGLRLDVQEAYLDAALAAGHHREVLAEIRARVAESPLREHRWALLARAQYQCGQQGEALATLHRARDTLIGELGVDPGPELVALEQALLRQDPSLDVVDAGPEISTTCPYLGLVPYDIDDADGFFGRDGDVAECLQRLAEVGAVTVVGPSGSGKSSLVRAGIGAALRGDGSRVVVITPGVRPMDALTAVPSGPPPVLIVDQCEEAVTLCNDSAERERFFAALAAHAEKGKLVVAIRADHLGHLTTDAAFARLVERSVHLLGVMGETELRSAIEGPARQAGLRLEPGLIDLLVREVEGEAAALPLLSHALHQTWQRREGRTLTVAGYQASGGIREAVGRSAEEVYDRVPADQRPVLRDLLLRLVTPTAEGEPVRSRVPRTLIADDPVRQQLVEQLVRARLLTSDEGVIELAHESLARAWPRMREWLEEDVEGQRILRHLGAAAESWDGMGRPASELYRGARLAKALEWRRGVHAELTPMETAFLDTSESLANADLEATRTQVAKERRTVRRLRVLLSSAAVLAVVALTASLLAVEQKDRADDRATVAEARRVAAQALVEPSYDRALLLGVEAVNLWDDAETRGNLVTTIERSPEAIGVIRPDTSRLVELQVSPDGQQVVVVDNSDVVTLLDVATRRTVATIGGDDGETSYLTPAFSPDGDHLAVSMFATSCWVGDCPRHGVEVFDTANLSSVETYEGLGMPALGVTFSGDGRFIAAVPPFEFSDLEENIAVWRVGETDEPFARLSLAAPETGFQPTPDSTPAGWVALSPDGAVLYASGAGPAVAFEVATGEVIHTFEGVGALDLSADGRTIAVLTETGTVALFDTATGRKQAELIGHESLVIDAAFNADGTQLATASTDETAAVWDVSSGDQLNVLLGHSGTVNGIDFEPEGSTLFTAGADRTVMMWDIDHRRGLVRELAEPSLPQPFERSVLVRPTGDGAAILGENVELVDAASGDITELGGGSDSVAWATYFPDGRLFATVADSGDVQLIDASTGDVLRSGPGRGQDNGGAIAVRPDGSAVVVADTDGRITELDSRTLEPTGRTVDTGIEAEGVRVTHDGLVAVTASTVDIAGGAEVVFADLDQGRILHRMKIGSWGPRANFSTDGKLYALGGSDGRLTVVDMSTYELSGPAEPIHHGPISWVSFSRDGRTLATIGFDGQLLLADSETGETRARIRPGRPNIRTGMVFLDDGHTLVIGYGDGSMLTYDTNPTASVAHACAVAGRNLTRGEWRQEFGDRPYRKTCPEHP